LWKKSAKCIRDWKTVLLRKRGPFKGLKGKGGRDNGFALDRRGGETLTYTFSQRPAKD